MTDYDISEKENKWLKVFRNVAELESNEFKNIRKQALELQVKALQNHYKWIFSVITLSSAIFGISISSLIGKDLIINNSCFYVGISLLFMNVVLGICSLKGKIERDVNGMANERAFLNDLIYGGVNETRKKIIESNGDYVTCDEAIKSFLDNRKAKLKTKEEEFNNRKNEKDYTADVMLYIFIGAVVFVFISVIPFSIVSSTAYRILLQLKLYF